MASYALTLTEAQEALVQEYLRYIGTTRTMFPPPLPGSAPPLTIQAWVEDAIASHYWMVQCWALQHSPTSTPFSPDA